MIIIVTGENRVIRINYKNVLVSKEYITNK